MYILATGVDNYIVDDRGEGCFFPGMDSSEIMLILLIIEGRVGVFPGMDPGEIELTRHLHLLPFTHSSLTSLSSVFRIGK